VGTPVISVEHLRKRYGEAVAVDDVSFEVAPGEIFGLLGPNGAGKTTTVECLQGLRRHDQGRVRVLALDPQENGDELRRRIGSQLQDSGLPSHLRVWEALDLFASIADHPTDTATLLERWGLGDKRDARLASLSGGQQQRLLVTHFGDEAERLCDRAAIVVNGRIVALDTPADLVAHHAPEIRITFMSDAPDLSWLSDVPCVRRVDRWGAASRSRVSTRSSRSRPRR
jgi:ABC-2 type transport system ATP-binding protein